MDTECTEKHCGTVQTTGFKVEYSIFQLQIVHLFIYFIIEIHCKSINITL